MFKCCAMNGVDFVAITVMSKKYESIFTQTVQLILQELGGLEKYYLLSLSSSLLASFRNVIWLLSSFYTRNLIEPSHSEHRDP